MGMFTDMYVYVCVTYEVILNHWKRLRKKKKSLHLTCKYDDYLVSRFFIDSFDFLFCFFFSQNILKNLFSYKKGKYHKKINIYCGVDQVIDQKVYYFI